MGKNNVIAPVVQMASIEIVGNLASRPLYLPGYLRRKALDRIKAVSSYFCFMIWPSLLRRASGDVIHEQTGY
jgi:hypothetical protein